MRKRVDAIVEENVMSFRDTVATMMRECFWPVLMVIEMVKVTLGVVGTVDDDREDGEF